MALDRLGFKWYHWAVAIGLWGYLILTGTYSGPIELAGAAAVGLPITVALVFVGRRVWSAPAAFGEGHQDDADTS